MGTLVEVKFSSYNFYKVFPNKGRLNSLLVKFVVLIRSILPNRADVFAKKAMYVVVFDDTYLPQTSMIHAVAY